jgi:hypothetical protein
MNRALCVAVFAALLVFGHDTKAQSFSISPQHELGLKATEGQLTTEPISFTNHTDKPLSISTSYSSDPTIGIDMPKVITLEPNEKVDFLISFLGNDGSARGEITLTAGDLVRKIDLLGNITEASNTDPEQESAASVYDAGNKEIALSVGPNPVVTTLNVSVRNAASTSITINDLAGKLMASSKANSFTWDASASNVSGTYFVTVRGITTSGKPFNETRKVVVN